MDPVARTTGAIEKVDLFPQICAIGIQRHDTPDRLIFSGGNRRDTPIDVFRDLCHIPRQLRNEWIRLTATGARKPPIAFQTAPRLGTAKLKKGVSRP